MGRIALSGRLLRRFASIRPGWAAAAKLALIAAIAALTWTGDFTRLQDVINDGRFSLVQRNVTGQMLLVDIDEPSIKALGAWPWSRAVHAAIVDKLVRLGASEIAFDVDFSSPSNTGGDAAFEDALKRADGSIILAAFRQVERSPLGKSIILESRPLPRFAAAAWEGSVNVLPDPDGLLRRLQPGGLFASGPMPSLSALVASRSGYREQTFSIDYGIDYRQLVHLSVRDLLLGTVDPSLVRDRKVIVGASAVELRDLFHVPRFGFIPGSAVQAMAAESILQDRTLSPPDLRLSLIFTVGVVALFAFLMRRLSLPAALGACAAAVATIEIIALWVQASWPVMPFTTPVDTGVLGCAAIMVADEVVARRVKLLASRRNAARLRSMLDRVIADNFAGIVIVDGDGRICATSAAAGTILAIDLKADRALSFEALPASLSALVAQALAALRAGRTKASVSCELSIARDAMPPVLLDCVTTVSQVVEGSSRTGASEHAVCLTFRDITAEREAHDRLARIARIDALSGLASRPVLIAAVDERQGKDAPGASGLIFFDIDRFKLVNDRLGHRAGDDIIRAVAARLMSVVAPEDVSARLGGDEFAVVVDRTTPAAVEAFAEALVQELTGVYEIGSFRTAVSLSMGLAFFDGAGTAEMMTRVDAALEAAKAAGGARLRRFDAEMAREAEDSDRLAHDLRIALELGEFEVVYQRQVDAMSERIIGVEALVRWRHPERGYISPARFIPVAERTGLIEPIGAWVLSTACREAMTWPEPIKVSVNLSAVQLAQVHLADLVLKALRDSGLPPERLDLELTESLMMDDDNVVRTTLGRLRAAGAKVSLDDFGTGYSSLSYLNRFAIDKVKIDQSFVRSLMDVSSTAAIVRAVITLAREIGLRVNAEGVETIEQLRTLQALGCDEVQGYLHGRPEPSAAIAASLFGQNQSPAVPTAA